MAATDIKTLAELNTEFDTLKALLNAKEGVLKYLDLFRLTLSYDGTGATFDQMYQTLAVNEAILFATVVTLPGYSWAGLLLNKGDIIVKTKSGPLFIQGPTNTIYYPIWADAIGTANANKLSWTDVDPESFPSRDLTGADGTAIFTYEGIPAANSLWVDLLYFTGTPIITMYDSSEKIVVAEITISQTNYTGSSYSGTLSGTNSLGMASTVGFVVGQKIIKISGDGILGTDASIELVNGPNELNLHPDNNTNGSLVFEIGGILKITDIPSIVTKVVIH